ncbi:sigma-70 region 4 domain-containing protein [Streptomyces sp. NPDC005476]|uniref:RNA polymerase sigma factor n=1 Tax=Streptomyces sp. NPDC005476 TaxID=3156882 RepID=UPI0034531617
MAIVAALRLIPYEQRRAIVLHHLVGLSVEETARETEVAPGTVKARLSRGRHTMAPHLSDVAGDRPGAVRPPGPRPAVPATRSAPAGATDALGSADQEVHHHD